MNQSMEAEEHGMCKGQIGYSCGTLQMPGWGALAYVLMVGVNDDFEENDMRTFHKVSLLLVCATESRKSGEIRLSWDMVKSLTFGTVVEIKMQRMD